MRDRGARRRRRRERRGRGASTVPLASSGKVDYLRHIGCSKDFQALASEPIDATLPGARSAKVVYDTRQTDGALYFQNSVLYQIHYDFASTHLSGNGLPVVPQLAEFNTTEYYSPEPALHPGRGDLLRGRRGLGARALAVRHRLRDHDRHALPGGEGRGLLRPGAGLPPHLRRRQGRRPRSCRGTSRSSPPTQLYAEIDYQPLNARLARRAAALHHGRRPGSGPVPVLPGHRRARRGAQRHLRGAGASSPRSSRPRSRT